MIRTQIQLEETQSAALKRAARRSGVSMAEAIRQSVDIYLAQSPEDEESKRERALAAIGAFTAEPRLSPTTDTTLNKASG